MPSLEASLFDVQLILAVLGELFFRSLLLFALFAMLMRTLNRGTLVLMFALVLPLWFLISDYRDFVVSVSGRSLLAFYVDYLNHWLEFYLAWSVVAVASL